MTGSLTVLGLGPGDESYLTLETQQALAQASDIFGYGAYLARLAPAQGQKLHESDNREEIFRARQALHMAATGRHIAVVSGGDPGVFAMAAAVLEAMEQEQAVFSSVDLRILPGLSAMHLAAAKLGAPLGHDFCAISLSSNLKPWPIIEQRLKAAAIGDFVVALYNPASKARPQQIYQAFEVLRGLKAPQTIVALAKSVGRPKEQLIRSTLADLDLSLIDMATLVLVGSSQTRQFGDKNWIYTPRHYPHEPTHAAR